MLMDQRGGQEKKMLGSHESVSKKQSTIISVSSIKYQVHRVKLLQVYFIKAPSKTMKNSAKTICAVAVQYASSS